MFRRSVVRGTCSHANCAAFCSSRSSVVTLMPLEKHRISRGDHETLWVGPARPTTSGKTKNTTKKLGRVSIESAISALVKPSLRRAPL